jgi:hypothetical protein
MTSNDTTIESAAEFGPLLERLLGKRLDVR